MPSQVENDKRDLNLYGQDPSLLFQFILAEFIFTFTEVQRMEVVYKEMETLLITGRFLANVDSHLDKLLSSVTQLTGSSMINEHISPWDSKSGSLSKLRHHCYPFVNRSDSKDKSIVNLNICVSKAFHSSLQAREIIIYLQQEKHNVKGVPDYAMLYQLLDRLIDNINRVSRLILRIIIQYRDNENVVYFLLRKRDELNTLYKTDLVSKIFRKMYPNEVEEAGQLLMKKYSDRGFKNLLNAIATKIAELGS